MAAACRGQQTSQRLAALAVVAPQQQRRTGALHHQLTAPPSLFSARDQAATCSEVVVAQALEHRLGGGVGQFGPAQPGRTRSLVASARRQQPQGLVGCPPNSLTLKAARAASSQAAHAGDAADGLQQEYPVHPSTLSRVNAGRAGWWGYGSGVQIPRRRGGMRSVRPGPAAPAPMSPRPSEDNLIWIDLEMTGLDPPSDSILEIATVVSDRRLNVLTRRGPEFAIRHPAGAAAGHGQMEPQPARQGPVCGSACWSPDHGPGPPPGAHRGSSPAGCRRASPDVRQLVCQDRRFLVRLMPRLGIFFHYRNLDVSTLEGTGAALGAGRGAQLHQGRPTRPSAMCAIRSPNCVTTAASPGPGRRRRRRVHVILGPRPP